MNETALHKPEKLQFPEPGCTHVARTRSLLTSHCRRVNNKLLPCAFPGRTKNFRTQVTLLKHQHHQDPNREFQCRLGPLRRGLRQEGGLHLATAVILPRVTVNLV